MDAMKTPVLDEIPYAASWQITHLAPLYETSRANRSGYHKYYRAISRDSQELSVISFIFVTYAKMLCKLDYVNFIYCSNECSLLCG